MVLLRDCVIRCCMTSDVANVVAYAEADSPITSWHMRALLRLEGLAAAAVATVFYARTGASWWMYGALFLVPDLSMLGYLGGPKLGARIYNAIHSYITPATLAVSALLLGAPGLVPFALIWASHIGVDRLLGYGLKYPEAFGRTHLGVLGKERREAAEAK
jgi:uncharacterized protein DUF4260